VQADDMPILKVILKKPHNYPSLSLCSRNKKNKNTQVVAGTPGITSDATKIQRHCTWYLDEVLENYKGNTGSSLQVKYII